MSDSGTFCRGRIWFRSAASKLGVKRKLFAQALKGEVASIETMFRTFLPNDETILACHYLGVKGIWGFGKHCWGCVTDRRFAKIVIGPFRGVDYQDVFGDRIEKAEYRQPSGWQYALAAAANTLSALFITTGVIEELQWEDLEPTFFYGLPDTWFPFIDRVDLGWSFLYALPLPIAWYIGWAVGRRFIKRGISCGSRRNRVEVYCDSAFNAAGIDLMREIGRMREKRAALIANA